MTRLLAALFAAALAALLTLPAQAETTLRADGLRSAEQTDFSSHRRWRRHYHWRGHRYWGPRFYYGPRYYWGPRYRYWGPRYRYYRYGYYRPFYRPAVSVSFGFGPRYGWWW